MRCSAAATRLSGPAAPASAAPSRSGPSTVYFADLYLTTRSALATVPVPAAWPSRSRYCPAIISVRIASNTG